MAQNRSFVSAPLHEILKVMPHTAHHRSLSLLSAAGSSSSRRHLACSSARRVFRYHALTESSTSSTSETGDTYIPGITVEKAEAALARNQTPKRIQAAQQQQCGYVCIQARLISTNPGSMEEACEHGLPRGTCFVARRLELVARLCAVLCHAI